ncbi:MAG TPA: hypothetical protein VIX63_00795 [Vicinamibacterales bacterium]
MRRRGSNGRAAVAVLAVFSLLSAPGGGLSAWMQVATGPAPSAPDGDWPRRYTAPDGGVVVLYEPQVAGWQNQKLLTLHAAVSHTPKGGDTGQLGTIIAEADTRVSVAQRLVDFSSFRITQSNFPNASREEASAIVAAIKASIPIRERVLALDRVLAYQDASLIRPTNVDGIKADPPVVFFSTRTAVMVNVDGDAIWSPIQGNDLRFAVNTNWDLFEHPPSKTYYLRHGDVWLKATSLPGPWAAAGPLPASFSRLPADDNWQDVRAAVPGRTPAASALPRVFVSTVPAELILLRGEPQYEPVPGTKLQWVRNTDSDVFRLGPGGTVYYLVAGRWFSAPGFDGPWTFASLSLPADFAKIPLEHERSRVLASVPGTVQAAEAVLLAQVPQTARVSKKMVKAPEVAYQGEPEFQPIAQTSVARATNTDKDIIKVGDLYYLCFQGVWFMARTPTGPWEVTGSVPQQIYEIPVSSPAHNVTYVTVEDDDDEWVVFATAAAYTGVMVAWGCAVWGTGFYYPPYVWYGGFYPAYFPYYPTYGYSAWYNPWTGTYGRGAAVYGPYGGAGIGARYNPRTGTYARGAAAYGPYGARGAAEAYNPRTGTYAATRQGSGVYGSWGSTGVRRGDQWATTSRVTNNVTGTTTRATRTAEGGAAVSRRGPQGSGFVGETGGGDVYAGRDGNVYRNQGGSWEKYDNGGWTGVQQPTPQQRDQAAPAQNRAGTDAATVGQLNRDSAARSDGAQRSRDAATARSGSAGARTGSYRTGGGGGARAGGGRR